MSMEEIFGEVISVYTRAQAHEDGILIDVNDTDGGRLFKFPCSITVALHSALSVGAGSDAAIPGHRSVFGGRSRSSAPAFWISDRMDRTSSAHALHEATCVSIRSAISRAT